MQGEVPAVWVEARQYTGRLVTVSNAIIFDEPIFNYSRDFPYIWEEMRLPVRYQDNRREAERILLEAARRHSVSTHDLSQSALEEMKRRYPLASAEMGPRVYYRLTDNWLELTVRFLVRDHEIREIKDAMSREILEALDAAKIQIASSTYDIVGLPPLQVRADVAGAKSGVGRHESQNDIKAA